MVAAWDAAGYPIHAAEWNLRYVASGGTVASARGSAAPPNPLAQPLA